MDYWNPPKKRRYDLIENALWSILLLQMAAAFLIIVCLTA